MHPSTVLLSPIGSSSEVLRLFLSSLESLQAPGKVRFALIDDTPDAESRQMLQSFAAVHGAVVFPPPSPRPSTAPHVWPERDIWRLASMRELLLAHARESGADAALVVDADLVLSPRTLVELWACRVDVVSEVYWTRFQSGGPELPNIWHHGQYELDDVQRGEPVDPAARSLRAQSWLAQIRTPGLREVGGLGGCTLISAAALAAGAGYAEIPTLDLMGEDRHFCVRMQALGFRLYAHTGCPPLHLYRRADLGRVEEWRRQDALWIRYGRMVSALVGAGPSSADPTSRTLVRSARLTHTDGEVASVEAELVQFEDSEVRVLEVSARICRDGGDWSLDLCEQISARRSSVQRQPVRHCRQNRICLCMIVRDEADRYLARVLRTARGCVDCAVIVDDGSVDGSATLAAALLDGVPHRIVRLERSLFGTEHRLRRLAFRHALREDPDWILALDADEEPEAGFALEIRELVNQGRSDVQV